MKFTKMHGTGNDYVIVDALGCEIDRTKEEWSDFSRRVCDRKYGVGADGLLLVCDSEASTIRMRMFNPDGSESEMCGNGIRCFTKYFYDRNVLQKRPEVLDIETADGVKIVQPVFEGTQVTGAVVDMGMPRIKAVEIPVNTNRLQDRKTVCIPEAGMRILSELKIDENDLMFEHEICTHGATFSLTAISMGNPHAVSFWETPVDTAELETLGPEIETHPLFPNRVNFHIVNVLDRTHVKARHWERGAGMTLACGTGACAIAVAGQLGGLIDNTVNVEVPGGILTITWDPGYPVSMEGPAIEVFEGVWPN